ncbi:unnamed protein product [Trifolium pratense]|uniref:Uncharacterized protein n=1 Tax=Trifolium pratense TaxID=57577 RepID=A0ACB0MFZ2_TRIPR|nr:unnamed protein product [Trifolium pratense]
MFARGDAKLYATLCSLFSLPFKYGKGKQARLGLIIDIDISLRILLLCYTLILTSFDDCEKMFGSSI